MKKTQLLVVVGLFVLALFTLVENIAVLFQCPGLADESWQLYVIQNKICRGATFFVRYFDWMADFSFVKSRAVCLILRLLVGVFLGWATFSFFRERFRLTTLDKWIMIGVVPCLFSTSQAIVAPSYVSLNYIFGCLSIGSFAMAMRNAGRHEHIWSALSGLFVSHVIFVMATNMVIVPLMVIMLFVIRKRLAMSFLVGCLLGVALFFCLVCSPSAFIEQIFGMSLDATKTDGHDISMLVRWLRSTAVSFLPFVAVGMLHSFVSMQQEDKSWDWWKIVTIVVLFAYAGLHTLRHLRGELYVGTFVRVDLCLLYAATASLVYRQLRDGKLLSADNLVMLLFWVAPVCLSFGTNIEFAHRGGRYMIFLLLIMWPLLKKNWSWAGTLFMLLFMGTYIVFTFHHLRLGNCYTGVRLIDSRVSLGEFGSRCRTTPAHLDQLKKLRAVAEDRATLIGGRYAWSSIILLSKKHLANGRFAYTPDQVPELLATNPVDKKDVVLLEQPDFLLAPENEKAISAQLSATRLSRTKISPDLTVVTFE